MLASLYSEVRFMVASSWKFSLTLYLFPKLYSGVAIVFFFHKVVNEDQMSEYYKALRTPPDI